MRLTVSCTDLDGLNKQSLSELFELYGPVRSIKIFRGLGNSKVLGFVEMEFEEDAINALEGLNGVEVAGILFTVSISREMVQHKLLA